MSSAADSKLNVAAAAAAAAAPTASGASEMCAPCIGDDAVDIADAAAVAPAELRTTEAMTGQPEHDAGTAAAAAPPATYPPSTAAAEPPPIVPAGVRVEGDALERGLVAVRHIGGAKGVGVFAKVALPSNTWVGDYVGEVLTQKKYLRRYPNEDAQYVLGANEDYNVDAVDPAKSAFTRYLNHAGGGAANVFFDVAKVRKQRAKQIKFYTARHVDAGEELCFDCARRPRAAPATAAPRLLPQQCRLTRALARSDACRDRRWCILLARSRLSACVNESSVPRPHPIPISNRSLIWA